jgi:hypothetical protein
MSKTGVTKNPSRPLDPVLWRQRSKEKIHDRAGRREEESSSKLMQLIQKDHREKETE